MSTSSVTTSGDSVSTAASAACPSAAVPTTSIPGSAERTPATVERTSAESSTTRTRTGSLGIRNQSEISEGSVVWLHSGAPSPRDTEENRRTATELRRELEGAARKLDRCARRLQAHAPSGERIDGPGGGDARQESEVFCVNRGGRFVCAKTLARGAG